MKKNTFKNAKAITIDGTQDALLVSDPHTLIQAAGYLKYGHASGAIARAFSSGAKQASMERYALHFTGA